MSNNTIKLAVAAALALGASAAQAGIIVPAGDWTLDFGGNVNTYYTYSSCDSHANAITGTVVGGACSYANSNISSDNKTSITTGLLPTFLSVSGKTRQNDLDVGFTISINPGTTTKTALNQSAQQENRQSFLTVGDKAWGTVKLGKDLGIFGSDALLSDMTLLGVGGTAGQLAGAQNTTTTGRIGSGYMYADWITQISYASPNWNGFSFAVGVMEPWNASSETTTVVNNIHKEPTFQGKAQYEWAGDVAGKVWVGGTHLKLEGITAGGVAATAGTSTDQNAYELGAKVSMSGFEVVGYYYNGEAIGIAGQGLDALSATGASRDSDGGYIQGTYVIPGVGTKIGASWGVSRLDKANAADSNTLVKENRTWVIGAYHPLTKSLNLVAEYSDTKSEAQLTSAAASNKSSTFSAGAILFF